MKMNRVDLKVVLLGHEAVGKTSLVQRFINDKFIHHVPYQNTIGSAFVSKEVEVKDRQIVLGIWDTAGSERYQAMTKIYYRGAAAAIVCYDVTNPETFSRAKFWLRELRGIEDNCKIYLCATKKDLIDGPDAIEPNPDLGEVEKYADGIQAKFFLTSSKTSENVVEIFNMVAEDFALNPVNAKKVEGFITLTEGKKRSRCCPLL